MSSRDEVKRILVIRVGALGDVVLTLPAVHALRHAYPSASICAVGYRQAWELAQNLVDERLSIDSAIFSSLYSALPDVELREWLHQFDLVIAWSTYDLAPALEASEVNGLISASPYPPPGVHCSDWLIETLADLPIPETNPWDFRLTLAESDMISPSQACTPGSAATGGSRIVLHPGAGARWKCWPPERFSSVIRSLRRAGRHVSLLQGPADGDAVGGVNNHLHTPAPVIHEPDLCHLGTVLNQANLFLGNDSGITHLAAVLGVPTVALFGPTDPASWRPLGSSLVLRRCHAVAAEQGQVRVCNDPKCLHAVSEEEVLTAVEKCVNKTPFTVERGVEGTGRL